jgi:hypothetical protein
MRQNGKWIAVKESDQRREQRIRIIQNQEALRLQRQYGIKINQDIMEEK